MKTGERSEAIDQYRGLAIVLMVVANFINDVEVVPPWVRHPTDVGLSVIDFIAPMFVFAIGLTFGASVRRRAVRDGLPRTVGHFFRRGMVLVGLGAIMGAGEIVTGVNEDGFNWGVLQALGVSIMLALPVLSWLVSCRIGVGLGLLGCYQALLDGFWLDAVRTAPHGGLQGSLGWAAMMILATGVADLFLETSPRSRRWGVGLSLGLVAAGLAIAAWVPISKARVSASYVLITLGTAGVLFAVTRLLVEARGVRSAHLRAWGRNPLLLYLIHSVVLALFVLPPAPWWHVAAPWWLVLLQVAALLFIMDRIALWLERRRLVLTL
jgi:predicted acyltransferase